MNGNIYTTENNATQFNCENMHDLLKIVVKCLKETTLAHFR